ncbi:MAG: hypothetical protein HYV07_14920 [Deltaproteobacteria bacterium]|nr:hypothetical protein [Deltaproteobacteria bacterium]
MKRVMVICSGNICRSPMAAAMVEKSLRDAKVPSVVISAGTLGINGQPAAANAITVMKQIGIDISSHRSQGVSAQMLTFADHLIVMEPIHEAFVRQKAPTVESRIQRMWDYAEPRGRLPLIPDPVGQELEAFAACRDELVACVAAWARWSILR